MVEEAKPKSRPKEHPCESFKNLDLYGIDPSMMIGGKPKFRSGWGVCFSMFTYLSVLFFAYNKMIFLYVNRFSHFVERNVYYDFNSTQGQEIMNL